MHDKTNSPHAASHNDELPLDTNEKYFSLKRDVSCCKSLFRSTSTIFYDLDDLAKRHSFNCLAEVSISYTNILKAMKLTVRHACDRKSNTLAQEFTTQMQPEVFKKHTIESFSSQYLKDSRKRQYFDMDVKNHMTYIYDIYRSCANKNQTEYVKPHKKYKNRKKDQARQIENSCPGQLCSYACVDEKSQTELRKVNLTRDQITSTTKVLHELEIENPKPRQHEPTNTIAVKIIDVLLEPKHDTNIVKTNYNPDTVSPENVNLKNKRSTTKKFHKVICPNCKEKVDAVSITGEKALFNSSCKQFVSAAAYNCSSARTNPNKPKYDNKESKIMCSHEPQCKVLPVCQILPIDDIKHLSPNPRIIRITKACRHHPPCTVVPSCQRVNVLRNNCEFIPPCLHRPRCVNLPLCVPLAKSIIYEELGVLTRDNEISLCQHSHKSKSMSLYEHDSLVDNVEHHTQVQNAGQLVHEYYKDCVDNPKTPMSSTSDPILKRETRLTTSNKSCQLGSSHCKSDSCNVRQRADTDTIMYIRDVGCQFEGRCNFPDDSKTSRGSLQSGGSKTRQCSITVTSVLQCPNKSRDAHFIEDSLSTDSIHSMESHSNCRQGSSHVHETSDNRYSGFHLPRSTFVTTYAKTENYSYNNKISRLMKHRDNNRVKYEYGRHFIKGRYRKRFAAKRQRPIISLNFDPESIL